MAMTIGPHLAMRTARNVQGVQEAADYFAAKTKQ